MEEIKAAVNKGAGKKAPGRDGICLEYFKTNWDMIKGDMLVLFKQMYRDCKILEQQKQGTVVCIPKTLGPSTPADYRPITLLNTDYKILARIIGNHLRPLLSELLHTSKYCGDGRYHNFRRDSNCEGRNGVCGGNTRPTMYPVPGF